MTWGNRAQRRADEFAALVERSSTGERTDDVERDAELLEVVGSLRAVPEPQPRPEFVADLRGRLMTEAETVLVPDDLSKLRLPARQSRRERRLAAVIGGIAIVGATTSVAVASQSALPGESLYPIKRVIESAHATLSPGEAGKGSITLSSATDRLEEAAALAASDDLGAQARVAPTLSTFSDQATHAADLLFADYEHNGNEASVAKLRDFASGSLTRLEDLEPDVPNDARDELIAAANVVAQIDAEAAQQCPDCGGTPIETFPPSLTSAQPIVLPTVPDTLDAAGARDHGENHGKDHGKKHPGQSGSDQGQEDSDPDLPVVGDAVPPGSVLDPADPADPADPSPSPSPSGRADPLKDLTDGLTGALTGGKSEGGGGTSGSPSNGGSTPSTDPVTGVVTGTVEGVGGILQGVLDPITGTLLPQP